MLLTSNAIHTSFIRYLLIVFLLILLMVGCDPGNDKKATTTSDNHPEACTPLRPTGGVIARATWLPHKLQFQLVGKRVGVGKSDGEFEIIDTQLLLTKKDGSCLISQTHIGELTRMLSDKIDETAINETNPLKLSIEPLGAIEGNINAVVAYEQTQLSENTFLLVVYHQLEVKWGLTEFYATLVTINKQQMITGDRVLVGRDAMQPPVYYGEFKTEKFDGVSRLVLTRIGDGSFDKRVVFKSDSLGAFREVISTQNHDDSTRNSSVPNANSIEQALKECGQEGVLYALSKPSCSDGAKPLIERKGSIGRAADGHFIDEYSVSCQGVPESTKLIYVDAYHCHRQSTE